MRLVGCLPCLKPYLFGQCSFVPFAYRVDDCNRAASCILLKLLDTEALIKRNLQKLEH